jgi:hypothetical protein
MACVAAPSRVIVKRLMEFVVPTKKVLPLFTLVGAEEMTGRAPMNKYGGEYTSPLGSLSPPEEMTRPSGMRIAVEW